MSKPIKFIVASLAAASALTLSVGANAMPAAPKEIVAQTGDAAGVEKTHAVWVCGRRGCFWSYAHPHGGYRWGGGGYGWRGGGWGWRGGGWHGGGWHGGGWHGGGWHGGGWHGGGWHGGGWHGGGHWHH